MSPTTLVYNASFNQAITAVFSVSYVSELTHANVARCILSSVGKLSASYFALISWLLTLVAMDTDVIEAAKAPFRVIGLQQMLLDGQLALHVAIIPVKQFTARDLRSRSKVIQLC